MTGSQRDRIPRNAGRQAHIIATVTSRQVQIMAQELSSFLIVSDCWIYVGVGVVSEVHTSSVFALGEVEHVYKTHDACYARSIHTS